MNPNQYAPPEMWACAWALVVSVVFPCIMVLVDDARARRTKP